MNVTLKLTNLSDRSLVVFGAALGTEYYGQLFDDSQWNVYDAYAYSTNAPRPPGNTPQDTATACSRRPEGGKRLDAHQTTLLEYQPMKQFGQQWRRPTRFTFKVGIWIVSGDQNGHEARGDSLSCDVPAAR